MLLAVPPEGTVDDELVLDAVLETIEWMQLRAVAPDDLGDFGHALPTTMVPGQLDGADRGGGVVIGPWDRIEGSPHDDELDAGVEAHLADPLWLLTRQWQVGELRADDAARPVAARLEWRAAPVQTYRPGSDGPRLPMPTSPPRAGGRGGPSAAGGAAGLRWSTRLAALSAVVWAAPGSATPSPPLSVPRASSCASTTPSPSRARDRPQPSCCAGAASTVPPSSPRRRHDRRGALPGLGATRRNAAIGVIDDGATGCGSASPGRSATRGTRPASSTGSRSPHRPTTGRSCSPPRAHRGAPRLVQLRHRAGGGACTEAAVIDVPPASTPPACAARLRSLRSRRRCATPACRRLDGGRSRRATSTSATSPRRPVISDGCSWPTTRRCTATTGSRSRCGSRRAPWRRCVRPAGARHDGRVTSTSPLPRPSTGDRRPGGRSGSTS